MKANNDIQNSDIQANRDTENAKVYIDMHYREVNDKYIIKLWIDEYGFMKAIDKYKEYIDKNIDFHKSLANPPLIVYKSFEQWKEWNKGYNYITYENGNRIQKSIDDIDIVNTIADIFRKYGSKYKRQLRAVIEMTPKDIRVAIYSTGKMLYLLIIRRTVKFKSSQ